MPSRITFEYRSLSGGIYSISPDLVPAIQALIDQVRADILVRKQAGCFVGYLSVPISSKSGGDFRTNIALAAHVAARVQREFGDQLWLVNPAAYNLPQAAGGADYMAVWSDVIAGADGTGAECDLVYFVGPSDVWKFFGLDGVDRLGGLTEWLRLKAVDDPEYGRIHADPGLRQRFLRYYGLRGSTVFSKGAHDEWNIVVNLNANRPIGEDMAVYFDGMPVEPGDYGDPVDQGYQTQLR